MCFAPQNTDKRHASKPIENCHFPSLASFSDQPGQIIGNLNREDQPFIYNYYFSADRYAKPAGHPLIVRPRVLGNKSQRHPREQGAPPVSGRVRRPNAPNRIIDVYEITLRQVMRSDETSAPTDAAYA